MGFGRVGMALVLAAGIGCAHFGASRPDRPVLAAGKYAVESIRSRAQLDGIDQLIEISETGTRLTDANGAEHVLTERGALMLEESGQCRLALAVSVDGEEPGVSDRACRWQAPWRADACQRGAHLYGAGWTRLAKHRRSRCSARAHSTRRSG